MDTNLGPFDTLLTHMAADPERPVFRAEDGRLLSVPTVHRLVRRRRAGRRGAWAREDGAIHFGPSGRLTPVVPVRRELPEDSPQRFPGSADLAHAIEAVEPDFHPVQEGETWWLDAGEAEDGRPILMACDFYMLTRALAFEQLQDALDLLEEEDAPPQIIPMWVWGSFSLPAPN
jgi:hypothetical protein